MKKVLEVFGEPISNGGQESFVFNILQHMDLKDMHVDVLTPYYCENNYYRKIVEDKGGNIITLNLPFFAGANRFNVIKPLDKYLRDNPYDIIHVHSGSISILTEVTFIAHKHHIEKIIVHSHCAGEKKTFKYRMIKLISTPILNNYPTQQIACSQAAGKWKFSKKVVENELVILKNGVELQKFAFNPEVRDKMRKKLRIDKDTYVVGHVGRFCYQKNHEYLIDVFEQLKKRHHNSVLLLIGSGENLEFIKELVSVKRLEESVYFVNNVNNVNEYMQAMDVFVLPSRFEGLPIVGVEAQASGLPVLVSTNVSSELALSESVEFISLGNKEKWTQRLVTHINSKRIKTAEDLTQNGYNIEVTVKELQKIYEE